MHNAKINKSLIICTTPRSGSSFFSSLLLSTSKAGWPTEWLSNGTVDKHWELLNLKPEQTIIDYINAVMDERHTPNGVFGIKMMWFAVEYLRNRIRKEIPQWIEYSDLEIIKAIFPNPVFVYHKREDKLAQAISHYKAVKTDIWVEYNEKTSYDKNAVPYDREKIQENYNYIQYGIDQWEAFFKANNISPIRTTYEDITKDPRPAIDKVEHALFNTQGELEFKYPEHLMKQRDDLNTQFKAKFLAEGMLT